MSELECDWWERPMRDTCEVDDVHFVWPVGFIWFRKPRYRIKAISVRR